MPFTPGSHQDNSYQIVLSNFEELESQFYETKYQEIRWEQMLPSESIETNINPGAVTTSYRVLDQRGIGGFLAHHANTPPTVGSSVRKVPVPIQTAGIGGIITRDDIRQYQFAYGSGLDTEITRVMRWGCDYHIEGVFFFGQAELGFEPFLDYPNVPVTTAVDPGSGTEWTNKTPDQILFDINDAISQVWVNSLEIHLPGRIVIPTAQFALIAGTRIPQGNDLTVLEWIRRNNTYTARTGQELEIVSLPYLDGAGVGGADRMIVVTMERDIHKFPFPIPYNLLDPQLVGYETHLLAEYRFGSYHNRYPLSMRYVDGI